MAARPWSTASFLEAAAETPPANITAASRSSPMGNRVLQSIESSVGSSSSTVDRP
jgi:hypothetical protein